MEVSFAFDYEHNSFATPNPSEVPPELQSVVSRFRTNLCILEQTLHPGDSYVAWLSENTDILIVALMMSHWDAVQFDIPEDMTALYFPNSNFIKFAKGNLRIVLGLMQTAEKNSYAPSLTAMAI